MIPLKLLPMPGVLKDADGEVLLDESGEPVLAVSPKVQQRIIRSQDNLLVGYVSFNPKHTNVSIILPETWCPAGFANHVHEFIRSEFPDSPEIRGSQVPEPITPEELEELADE